MHAPCRGSRPRGPWWGLLLGVGLAGGCDEPAPREARPAAATRVEPSELPPQPRASRVDEAVPAAIQTPLSLEALSAEERDRVRAAVAEGRRLHGEEDYAGAIEAFERALELLPDDARTLSELGWAQIFAGRLEAAESSLRRAEAGVGDDDRLRASILYNLGRVAEARGADAAAIEAYQRSLRLRPHRATYQHLSGLAGGTRYAFGPTVRRLQGPYARLSELCQEERRLTAGQRTEAEGETFGCLPDAAKGLGGDAVEVPRARGLEVPWKGLRFVEIRPNPFTARFHAALRTEAGWFVLPEVAAVSRGVAGTTERVTRLSAKIEPLFLAGGPQVVLEIETRWVVEEGGRELESETHAVEFLCGLGPSGVPSCTGALPRVTQARRREAGGVEQTRWAVERQSRPEGVIVLSSEAALLDEPAAALLGEHVVEFL